MTTPRQIATDQIEIVNTELTSASGSIAWDMSSGDNFYHTFTEDTTLANPTGVVIGRSMFLYLTQHASSPKTLSFGSGFVFAGKVAPTITATAGAEDQLQLSVRMDGKILVTSALNIGVPA